MLRIPWGIEYLLWYVLGVERKIQYEFPQMLGWKVQGRDGWKGTNKMYVPNGKGGGR